MLFETMSQTDFKIKFDSDTCNKQGFAFKFILDSVEFCRPSQKYIHWIDLIYPMNKW